MECQFYRSLSGLSGSFLKSMPPLIRTQINLYLYNSFLYSYNLNYLNSVLVWSNHSYFAENLKFKCIAISFMPLKGPLIINLIVMLIYISILVYHLRKQSCMSFPFFISLFISGTFPIKYPSNLKIFQLIREFFIRS